MYNNLNNLFICNFYKIIVNFLKTLESKINSGLILLEFFANT
ncbi:hypothetical protein HFN_1111 [Helicobacter fennelliae MRY12-0050]|uniref:Uncharacterized protein n=1 Tax=Helicobacter fennelliae MRY12-0050 TaxID=1325130 RepID=T1D3R2_9HELI|nr:hypothetical protein HFN_1111 [Helicobacter fennelliae MRY12-0050]